MSDRAEQCAQDETPSPSRKEQRALDRSERDAANRRISAELKASKSQIKRQRLQHGLLAKPLEQAARKHPGDPRAQLVAILDRALIRAVHGRDRLVSDHRQGAFNKEFQHFITALQQEHVHLQNLGDFSQKHALTLMRRWQRLGIAASTIQNWVSVMRRVLTLIGKAHVVPDGRKWKQLLLQNNIELGGRSYIPELSKGWRDQGVDVEGVLGSIQDERARMVLDLMHAFGLRDLEGLMLQPGRSDRGTFLHVYRGTKGGKARMVCFSDRPDKAQWQRTIMDRAKVLAAKHLKEEIGWPGLTLEQCMNRFQNIVTRCGITKSELGVVPYGLRHQFATDLFRDLTGLPAPVLKELPWSEYEKQWNVVSAALLEISRQLGHERTTISHAYIGSSGRLQKEDQRTKRLLRALANASGAFAAAGVQQAWTSGGYANGTVPMRSAAVVILVRIADENRPAGDVRSSLETLQAALTDIAEARLVVSMCLTPEPPADAIDIPLAGARALEEEPLAGPVTAAEGGSPQ